MAAQCKDILEKLPAGVDTKIGTEVRIYPVARRSASRWRGQS